ncbi:MAG: HEPN domain-containing protein [Epsilonproteobacteria bacterium]|nr:HEPN domain-containing protein [Campylobacterota bacterium]
MLGHEAWLKIAQEDLLAAKGLCKLELFSSAVYHCQQSAEKSLKAYLVSKKNPILKTHDLIKLLEVCMSFDKEFEKKFDAANYISPFSSKFRYPTEFEVPDKEETQQAISCAQSIFRFVLRKIAKPQSGQSTIFDR